MNTKTDLYSATLHLNELIEIKPARLPIPSLLDVEGVGYPLYIPIPKSGIVTFEKIKGNEIKDIKMPLSDFIDLQLNLFSESDLEPFINEFCNKNLTLNIRSREILIKEISAWIDSYREDGSTFFQDVNGKFDVESADELADLLNELPNNTPCMVLTMYSEISLNYDESRNKFPEHGQEEWIKSGIRCIRC